MKNLSLAVAFLLAFTALLSAPAIASAGGHSDPVVPVTYEVALVVESVDMIPASPAFDVPIPQDNNEWLDKTAAFTECIFGVGVPIGVAWAVATNPALLMYVMRVGPLPVGVPKTTLDYVERIKSRCAYALS